MILITHVGVSLLVGRYIGVVKSIWDAVIIAFASIYPDIDNPFTMIGKMFRPLSYKIHEISGHRGFTHSLLFLALVFITFIDFWKERVFLLIGLG